MLPNTFIHLTGVGEVTERAIWDAGVTTWEEFLGSTPAVPRIRNTYEHHCGYLETCRSRLEASDAAFFDACMPRSEKWRLYADFRRRAAFLDIETTGLSPQYSYITMVGVLDSDGYTAYVRDENMEDLRAALERYDLIVTYNGTSFDLPFIEHFHGRVFRSIAHLDLRFPLHRLGYRGGLKAIERRVGLERPSGLGDLTGYDAVLLWRMWLAGDSGARDTLVRYNAEDVAALPTLADFVYNRLSAGTPAGKQPLDDWPKPRIDLPYDTEVIDRLRAHGAHRRVSTPSPAWALRSG